MKKAIYCFVLIIFSTIMHTAHAQGLGEWTWMKGSNTDNDPGNFGTKGVSAPSNNPPALYESCEWTDLDGNFWLFGGQNSSMDLCNALWKFDPSTNEWIWVSGSSTTKSFGNYGTQGVPGPNNVPSARGLGITSWVDLSGDLWLFGGYGHDASGNIGVLNDVWRYNIANDQWTWMKGSNSVSTASVIVSGTKGVANPANTPNGRYEISNGLTDKSGDLWFFGGLDYRFEAYNDIWKYNIASNNWTWVAGNQTKTNAVSYGTFKVSSPTNDPGDRNSYTKYIDDQNNLYFLGSQLDNTQGAYVMDVWKFNPTSTQWTWVGGSSIPNYLGAYDKKCDTNTVNSPKPSTETRSCWPDKTGFFFLMVEDASLWYFNIADSKFTWVSNSGTVSSTYTGNYGTMGVSAPTNFPPAKSGALGFKDSQSNLWLFGGTTPGMGMRNDLWRFKVDPDCIKTAIEKDPTETIDESIYIPNVFTPNGDNSNNLFTVKTLNYKAYHIMIYDRWGLNVFESSDKNLHWNGKIQNSGAECSDGTYFYIIHVTDKNDKTTDYKGVLTLLR